MVVEGGHNAAHGALARLERLFKQNGIAATFQAFELDLRRPLQDLRWRASQLRGPPPRAWRRALLPGVVAVGFHIHAALAVTQ